MPRFLHTYTGKFVWIADIGANPYAILSHTWRSEEDGGEQTYDELVKLQAECPTIANFKPWNRGPPPPVNEALFSHPNLSDKIRRACEVARKAGYRLIWIDSCCIDKRSSAELSEAINSMYALYRDADLCFVFLADVPHGTDPRAEDSQFKWSRWHYRGWTLQELVAPAYVVFLTCDWTFLGTKTGLASTLEKITKIDTAILLGIKPVESASVAKRMSWAAVRQTARVEDRAYPLLGIFGVHMSPIYGEGTNAFPRLQEEIIKHVPDQSIFAWGRSRTLLTLDKLDALSRGRGHYSDYGLLADSPDAFWDVGDVVPITSSDFAIRMGRPRDLPSPPLHCVFTPQGTRIALMTIPLPPDTARKLATDYVLHCSDCKKAIADNPFRRLALLRCTDRDGHLITLPLRCPEEDVKTAQNVAIGVHASCDHWNHASARVVRLSAAMNVYVMATCVEVSILRHFQEPTQPKAHMPLFSKTFSKQWYDTLSLWHHGGKEPEIQLAPNCEEELRAVGSTLTQRVELHQSEDHCSAEITLTTTLNAESVTQRPPRDDQQMHVQLGLRSNSLCEPLGHFSVHRPHGPSAIELPPLASLEPPGSSSRRPLGDISVMGDNGHRQSRSFTIYFWSSTRTIAEVAFLIPDCDVDNTGADEVSTHYVRLLRLKLERPLESAYDEDGKYLLFSLELSEPFMHKILSTKPKSAGILTTSSDSLERCIECLSMSITQARVEPSIT
ncbi:heterokaryon incompatibility protein-domain-containing protein [Lenzites betulinus]|nr:heterokaryon incompatibility protein-domain-containing protein [Lenzites betulinus]